MFTCLLIIAKFLSVFEPGGSGRTTHLLSRVGLKSSVINDEVGKLSAFMRLTSRFGSGFLNRMFHK